MFFLSKLQRYQFVLSFPSRLLHNIWTPPGIPYSLFSLNNLIWSFDNNWLIRHAGFGYFRICNNIISGYNYFCLGWWGSLLAISVHAWKCLFVSGYFLADNGHICFRHINKKWSRQTQQVHTVIGESYGYLRSGKNKSD